MNALSIQFKLFLYSRKTISIKNAQKKNLLHPEVRESVQKRSKVLINRVIIFSTVVIESKVSDDCGKLYLLQKNLV